MWVSGTFISMIIIITVMLPVQCVRRKTSPRARNQCCHYLLFWVCMCVRLTLHALMRMASMEQVKGSTKSSGCHFGVHDLDWLLEMFCSFILWILAFYWKLQFQMVSLIWSSTMTAYAGLCYICDKGTPGVCSITISCVLYGIYCLHIVVHVAVCWAW